MQNTKELQLSSLTLRRNSSRVSTENDLKLPDLMRSINQHGLLQPIGVRRVGKKFEVVYGNRRFHACKKLGHKKINVVLLEKQDDSNAVVLNLVENVQRDETNSYSRGRAYLELMETHGLTVPEVSARCNVRESEVKSDIKLFKVTPDDIAKKMISGIGRTRRTNVGKVSESIVKKIVSGARRAGVNSQKTKALLREVTDTPTVHTDHVQIVLDLAAAGFSAKDSVKRASKMAAHRPCFLVPHNEVNRLEKKHGMKCIDILKGIVYGEINDRVRL